MDKYNVSQFLGFKIDDSKFAVQQTHELFTMSQANGECIIERLQVACTINKSTPLWEDFGISLKDKTEDMNMKTLISAIRIQ